MRVCHYIKPNHRSETPSRAIFVSLDVSSKREEDGTLRHSWKTGTMITAVKNSRTGNWNSAQYTITNPMEFWNILDTVVKSKTRTYIVCHNSDLTLQLLETWNWTAIYGWKFKLLVIACPPCIVNLRRKYQTVTLLDVQNIWPTLSLDTLNGESLQQLKEESGLPEDILKDMLSPARAHSMYRMLTEWWKFLKVNDLGGFSPTIGSQSFRVWRHKFMTHNVLIDLHDEALALARKGLYGGRCQALRRGSFSGTFYQVDINSSYCSVMREMRVPTKLLGYTEHTSVAEINGWIDDYVVIADVHVDTEKSQFPYRDGLRMSFPVGKFRTVLAGIELYEAIANRQVVQVHRAAVYEAHTAFESYMAAIWKYRQESRESGELVDADRWKLLGSSFFGKWAQKGGFWENVGETTDSCFRHWIDVDYHSGLVTEFRHIAGVVQQRSKEVESSQSHPAIAACITAGGRMKLWGLIERAGMENVFYVDTDSLLLNDLGFRRIYNDHGSRELGGLKLQGTYEQIQVFSPKHYRVGKETRLSGVKRVGSERHGRVCIQDERVSIQAQIRNGRSSGAHSRRVRKEFKDDIC